MNLKTNVGTSREKNGIFSVFISVLLCNMLGSVLQGRSTAKPIHRSTSKCPKPDMKPTWAATGSSQEPGCFLGGFPETILKNSINCVYVVWQSSESPAWWDNFSIQMSQSFQGFAKMPSCMGMYELCPCPVREESDTELFNTFEDRNWK